MPATSRVKTTKGRGPVDLLPIAGFAIILTCAGASLGGLRAYVDLTNTTRWGYTDLIFALFALTGCWIVLNGRDRATVVPLIVVTCCALALLGGQFFEVYEDFHGYGDDYLPAIIWLLGNVAMVAGALLGLILAIAKPQA